MKNKNNYFIILLSIAFCNIGCDKENGIETITSPYKIASLEEIENGVSKEKTLEIPNCRFDDEFYFETAENDLNLLVEMKDDICLHDPGAYAGKWKVVSIDSLEGEFLEVMLPDFKIHDSLRLAPTLSQVLENKNQFYKLIEFSEKTIIIQNFQDFSAPKTKNIWQLKLEKE